MSKNHILPAAACVVLAAACVMLGAVFIACDNPIGLGDDTAPIIKSAVIEKGSPQRLTITFDSVVTINNKNREYFSFQTVNHTIGKIPAGKADTFVCTISPVALYDTFVIIRFIMPEADFRVDEDYVIDPDGNRMGNIENFQVTNNIPEPPPQP